MERVGPDYKPEFDVGSHVWISNDEYVGPATVIEGSQVRLIFDGVGDDEAIVESFYVSEAPTDYYMDLKVTSIPIKAKTRKLTAKWSVDPVQDLDAYHMGKEAETKYADQVAKGIEIQAINEALGYRDDPERTFRLQFKVPTYLVKTPLDKHFHIPEDKVEAL